VAASAHRRICCTLPHECDYGRPSTSSASFWVVSSLWYDKPNLDSSATARSRASKLSSTVSWPQFSASHAGAVSSSASANTAYKKGVGRYLDMQATGLIFADIT
jgi:hypothetical protein